MGNTNEWLIFCGGVALQCYFIGSFFYYFVSAIRESRLKKHIKARGVRIEGRIVDTRLKRIGLGKSACIATYTYTVDGKAYSRRQEIDNDSMLSVLRRTNITVYYLADNPKRSRLGEGRSTVGRKVLLCIFSFIYSIILTLFSLLMYLTVTGQIS